MTRLENREILTKVRKHYAQAVRQRGGCCGPEAVSACCRRPGPGSSQVRDGSSGYSEADLKDAPEGAFLGLGCGNPVAAAAVRPGETVLDLGSGGGFDCFLAARRTGEGGRVIGVDMTPEMIHLAREKAAQEGRANVEFRLGEIEHLPVADGLADIVISNCVINLSPDKPGVFGELFRVLKPGGRLAIADMVALAPLPAEVRSDPALYCGCLGGALLVDELQEILSRAGFEGVGIRFEDETREAPEGPVTRENLGRFVVPAVIEGTKPIV